jgi:hypothetical protein
MRRELLLIGEMIEAAEQAQALVSGVDLETLTSAVTHQRMKPPDAAAA